ncbi:Ankyrin repeat domain-containing protein 13C-B [Camellia lanceoleosa]|uniref:Ankyrin repeat domain-containing protein 13C-B n=1 Tax=Camellia lanceoleosa TaxID=1840588 RepID=A0ACC0H2J6_9ERIC|nr:Ankyrin repeat domain-containing protein 13C-B [Camellia lanceoleosa]
MQLDSALHMGNSDVLCEDDEHGIQDGHENGDSFESCEPNGVTKERKSWFGWNKKGSKLGGDDPEDSKILKKFSKLGPEGSNQRANDSRRSSSDIPREDAGDTKKNKDKSSKKKKKKGTTSESKSESEYKKGLRPVLWLTSDFPLKTEELLPLLDILANKVKAVRRLRELLTTKLPHGTFPVKLAIPIVPTIRVLITFTKFEELQPMEEFSTPPSSPVHFEDAKSKESEGSTSWMSWMKGSRGGQSSDCESRSFRDETDPFNIPSDYAWVDANEKKRRMKAKKAKSKKHRKQPRSSKRGWRTSDERGFGRIAAGDI